MTCRPVLLLLLCTGVAAACKQGQSPSNHDARDASHDVTVGDDGTVPVHDAGVDMAMGPLPGSPDEPARDHFEFLEHRPTEDDYSPHPEMGGALVSHNMLVVQLEADALVGNTNAMLNESEAEIIGAVPARRSFGGFLILRFETTTHEELAARREIVENSDSVESATLDFLIYADTVTPTDAETRDDWSWEVTPEGGNWGHEIMGVPQSWNLVPAIQKRGTNVTVGIIDAGFDLTHPDLAPNILDDKSDNDGSMITTHGTAVAGLVGAVHGNGKGIDGVNPVAELALKAVPIEQRATPGQAAASQSRAWNTGIEWLISNASPSVINISMGLNFDASLYSAATVEIEEKAQDLADYLDGFGDETPTPILVSSAGNLSGDATYNSPVCHLAAERGDFYCVEALALNADGTLGREATTSVGGTDSAPGQDLLSTFPGSTYGQFGQTSAAAPLFAGALSFLKAVNPSLDAEQIGVLVDSSAEAVTGDVPAYPHLFRAAMQIEFEPSDPDILTMLADIDDGSPDGNTRLDREGNVVDSEDLDGDGGQGDDQVTMSDFRRFRDWLLSISGERVKLDGDVDHAKRDLNGDGLIDPMSDDNVFPRGDFNGDGRLDSTPREVPGFDTEVTDLDVLAKAFTDPDVAGTDLPALIDSLDVHAYADECWKEPDVVTVRSWVEDGAGNTIRAPREHSAGPDEQVFTVATDASARLKMEALDAGGAVVGGVDYPLDGLPGEDLHVAACADFGTWVETQDWNDGNWDNRYIWHPDVLSWLVNGIGSRRLDRSDWPGPRTLELEAVPGSGACARVSTSSSLADLTDYEASTYGYVYLEKPDVGTLPTSFTFNAASSADADGVMNTAYTWFNIEVWSEDGELGRVEGTHWWDEAPAYETRWRVPTDVRGTPTPLDQNVETTIDFPPEWGDRPYYIVYFESAAGTYGGATASLDATFDLGGVCP